MTLICNVSLFYYMLLIFYGHMSVGSGLWADISGKRQRFTLPADSVRDMTAQQLSEVMQEWDDVVSRNGL
jgi:hypothetical protein